MFSIVEEKEEGDSIESDEDLTESLETILALKGDYGKQQGLNKKKTQTSSEAMSLKVS